jgi:hypothetical protein
VTDLILSKQHCTCPLNCPGSQKPQSAGMQATTVRVWSVHACRRHANARNEQAPPPRTADGTVRFLQRFSSFCLVSHLHMTGSPGHVSWGCMWIVHNCHTTRRQHAAKTGLGTHCLVLSARARITPTTSLQSSCRLLLAPTA